MGEIIPLTTGIDFFGQTICQHILRADLVSGAMEGIIGGTGTHHMWNRVSSMVNCQGFSNKRAARTIISGISLPCQDAVKHLSSHPCYCSQCQP